LYTRQERQSLLEWSFNFECKCELCEKPSKESDENRFRLGQLDSDIIEVAQDNPKRAIILINEQLKLFEIENIVGQN